MSGEVFSNKLISTALLASSSVSSSSFLSSDRPSLIPRTFLFSNPSSPSALEQIATIVINHQNDPSLSLLTISSFIQCDGNSLLSMHPTQDDLDKNSKIDEFEEDNQLSRACVCKEHSSIGLDSRFETASLFSNFAPIQRACDSLRRALLEQQHKMDIQAEFVSTGTSSSDSFDTSLSMVESVKEEEEAINAHRRRVHLLLISDIDLCFQHMESSFNLRTSNQTLSLYNTSSSTPSPLPPIETASEALATLLSFASCKKCFNPSSATSPLVMIAISARHAKLVPPWLHLPRTPRRTTFSSFSNLLSYDTTEPALIDVQSASLFDDISISLKTSRVDVWFSGSSSNDLVSKTDEDEDNIPSLVREDSQRLIGNVVGYENLREKLHSSVVRPLVDAISKASLYTSMVNHKDKDSNQSPTSCPSSIRVSPCRGLLLHGPSGCGKTLLARSLAKEANLTLIHVQCPQLLSKFVGDSEAGLRDVFRTARAMAPSLLLLDDIDSIARARSGLEVRLASTNSSEEGNTINSMNTIATSHSSGSNAVLERLLSTLLNELDGIGLRTSSSSSSSSSMHHFPILVVGTCAASSTLDAALLRSGRLELHVFVHSPEPSDRLAILKESARKVKLSSSACDYLEELSRSEKLNEWSAAKISTIIKEAANFCIQDDTQEFKIEYLKRVVSGGEK